MNPTTLSEGGGGYSGDATEIRDLAAAETALAELTQTPAESLATDSSGESPQPGVLIVCTSRLSVIWKCQIHHADAEARSEARERKSLSAESVGARASRFPLRYEAESQWESRNRNDADAMAIGDSRNLMTEASNRGRMNSGMQEAKGNHDDRPSRLPR